MTHDMTGRDHSMTALADGTAVLFGGYDGGARLNDVYTLTPRRSQPRRRVVTHTDPHTVARAVADVATPLRCPRRCLPRCPPAAQPVDPNPVAHVCHPLRRPHCGNADSYDSGHCERSASPCALCTRAVSSSDGRKRFLSVSILCLTGNARFFSGKDFF